MKKALIIGVERNGVVDGPNGIVGDAHAMASLLKTNFDGSLNFSIKELTSDEHRVTGDLLRQNISDLYSGGAETTLLYFTGPGLVDERTGDGFLAPQHGEHPDRGIGLSEILEQANKSNHETDSTVIILDLHHSGHAGDTSFFGGHAAPRICDGVTILISCRGDARAEEETGRASFTEIILDGISGAAGDAVGRVTPSSLHAHVDQTLEDWERRPTYRANVRNSIILRRSEPIIPKEVLRRLPEYFPSPDHEFKLDPSFEPDRGGEAERLKGVPVNPDHVKTYRDLQKLNRHGLVVPTEHEHMWHSAVFSGGCRLTTTGKRHRQLAERRQSRTFQSPMAEYPHPTRGDRSAPRR